MIKRVTSEKFHEVVGDRYGDLVPKRGSRNHISWEYYIMLSEDGTDFLQSAGVIEVYGTAKGLVEKVSSIWVAPECRNIGFGTAMLKNMVDMTTTYYDSMYDTDDDGDKCVVVLASIYGDDDGYVQKMFEHCGFSVNGKSRGRTNMGKDLMEDE